MFKLSVIVAIYNKEKYIKKGIESIIGQTYRNLEILLIDDGSTDNTAQILDSYATKDDRIKVVHKENGGCTSARKLGVELHTGDAFAFIDGDDWIDFDMYEKMVSAMVKHNVDIVSTKSTYTDDRVFCKDDILKNYFLLGDVSICNKIFRSTSEMMEAFFKYEGEVNDVKCAFDFFCKAEKWAVIPGAFYNYRQDNVSYCRSGFAPSALDNVGFTTEVANKTLEICKDAYENAYMHVIHAKFDAINKVTRYGFEKEEYVELFNSIEKEYSKDIRHNIFKCLKTPYFSKNEKMQLFCIAVSSKLFMKIKKKYVKKHKNDPLIEAIKC